MVPLCAGVAVLLAVDRPAIGRSPARLLDWSLLACLLAVAAQLIPLSSAARGRLSPQAFQVDSALRLGAAPAVLPAHPLSLDAESTAWALALGAAYVGLFWCARAVFARGGVRTVTRGVTWLGLGLTVLVAVQRATSPKLLYWYFRPLDAGASPYGPFVSRNALATWLAMAVPLAIGYAAARYRSDSRTGIGIAARAEALDSTQLWLVGAACLMTGGLFGSMSRAGIIGAAVGLMVFIVLARTRIKTGRGLIWISASLTTMIAVALLANFGALAMRLQASTESGEWGRRAIWRDTWRMTRDFWLTGVGAGAFQRGMLVYQEGSRQFFFNHAHDEYLQLAAEGGLMLAVPAVMAVAAGVALFASRLRSDRTPIFWLRAGAVSGLVAVAIQSIWDTGLRTPANGVLFAVIAAIALHEPRAAHEPPATRHSSRRTPSEKTSSSS